MIETNDYIFERHDMVEGQLIRRGIADEAVLNVFRRMPRHLFVRKHQQAEAYLDGPMRIGSGQTISQPYMVAIMTEILELKPTDRLLEIGTGSGYQAAVAAELCQWVYSLEVVDHLAEQAIDNLATVGIENTTVYQRSGAEGLPEEAPFDKIIVTAAAPYIPELLKDQLVEGGFLVAPVGQKYVQKLIRYRKEKGELMAEPFFDCMFVPFVGL